MITNSAPSSVVVFQSWHQGSKSNLAGFTLKVPVFLCVVAAFIVVVAALCLLMKACEKWGGRRPDPRLSRERLIVQCQEHMDNDDRNYRSWFYVYLIKRLTFCLFCDQNLGVMWENAVDNYPVEITSLIAWFMGPTWGLPEADRTHVGHVNIAIWDQADIYPFFPVTACLHRDV